MERKLLNSKKPRLNGFRNPHLSRWSAILRNSFQANTKSIPLLGKLGTKMKPKF